MITTSQNTAAVIEALGRFQAVKRKTKRSGYNALHEADYSTLTDVWALIRKPLSAVLLAVVQEELVRVSEKHVIAIVQTRITHSSGEWIQTDCEAPAMPLGDSVAQEHTRLRRRGLAAILGLVQADTDGRSSQSTADKAAETRAAIAEKVGF